MRRFALLLVVAAAQPAFANGRPPGTSDIHFRVGHEQDVLSGMTFGLVISHDGGSTWHWMCEKAVHYGGMYDPIYSYLSSGGIIATTFDGVRVMRDGCNFDATMLATDTPPHFASTLTTGPDGAIYVAMADSKDGKIYKSTDDGMTFPQSATPGMINDWWQSMRVAPSDATRVYLSGYRLVSGNPKTFLLFKSIDGGQNFSPMSMTGIAPTSSNSAIDIVGVSATTPDTLYARVTLASGNIGDDLYISTNGGTSWTKILSLQDSMAILVRNNGDIVVGTQTLGSQVSHNNGTSWTPLTNPPHLSCLVEKANNEIWGCTLNYGSMQVVADGYGIMKTTDLTTWSPVMKYQDITGPEDCGGDTLQKTECIDGTWCGLKSQLGITSTVINCEVPSESVDITHKPPKGCCDTGDGVGPMTLALGALVGILVGRPRRRRS
jgi:hypothetical protein